MGKTDLSNRNDQPKELVNVGQGKHDYLLKYTEEDTSLDLMEKYKVLPIMKIIQMTTKSELKDQFGEGSVIILPGSQRLCKKKVEEFQVVPVFFYPEWVKWSDQRDKGKNSVIDRTLDESHEIATRAMDKNTRFEKYEGGPPDKPFNYRYAAHLNFICMVYGEHALAGVTCVLSFSRGEYRKGESFIQAAKLRRIGSKRAPLWSQIWNLSCNFREFADKKWYGIDYATPQDPFITNEEMENFHGLHVLCKGDYEKNIVRAAHAEDDLDEVVVDAAAASNTEL